MSAAWQSALRAATRPWPAAWQRARQAVVWRQARRWWARRGVWWLRLTLAVGMVFFVVAAHLYLANQAVVLWEDIRTMQYRSWQLWWDITTWQTDLAAQRNAHALQQAVEALDLTWPEPAAVLYVPVALPPAATRAAAATVPGVWAPPEAPADDLPPAYAQSLSQWLAQGGWDRVRAWLGWPTDESVSRP